MDEREALLRAAATSPDDDLPRLVYADWLEDHDDLDQAAFVRVQCELARTSPWEPFAVRCLARHPEWVSGQPWRHTLPVVDGRLLEWHPDAAFRRGMAWGLVVRQLSALLDTGPRLFDIAPIGRLYLPTATLDEWKMFARQSWIPRVRAVHFYGTATPVEPVRVLADGLHATGIEEVSFDATSRPGMPEILAGLLDSPMGQRLKTLRLAAGPDDTEELVSALCDVAPPPGLDELSLRAIPLHGMCLERLVDSALVRGLSRLDLTDIAYGHDLLQRLVMGSRRLTDLRLVRSGVDGHGLARVAGAEAFRTLRSLTIRAAVGYDADLPIGVGASETLTGLRSLTLARCGLGNLSVRMLMQCRFWPALVELDLRDNRLTDDGVQHLLDAPRPPDLTALWLGGNPIREAMADRLRDHFGDAVNFDVGDIGTGLE